MYKKIYLFYIKQLDLLKYSAIKCILFTPGKLDILNSFNNQSQRRSKTHKYQCVGFKVICWQNCIIMFLRGRKHAKILIFFLSIDCRYPPHLLSLLCYTNKSVWQPCVDKRNSIKGQGNVRSIQAALTAICTLANRWCNNPTHRSFFCISGQKLRIKKNNITHQENSSKIKEKVTTKTELWQGGVRGVRIRNATGDDAASAVLQYTHTVVLLCCWRTGELLDSFCFFSALCWTSGGLSEVLRRAFFADRPEGGGSLIVLLLLGVLLLPVLSAEHKWLGSSVLLFAHSGVRAKGSDRFMWYRLLLPESPSRRSRAGRKSHMEEVESSSRGRCKKREQWWRRETLVHRNSKQADIILFNAEIQGYEAEDRARPCRNLKSHRERFKAQQLLGWIHEITSSPEGVQISDSCAVDMHHVFFLDSYLLQN